MTDKSVVQLQNMLAPIKKSLDQISKRLDQHDKNFAVISEKLDQHDKNFAVISEKLDQHSRKLDQNTEALVNIEDTIKIYGDMYQVNNDNARKLEKRINFLEGKNGVVAPPELKLTNIV